jgi:hypothetical protein
MAATMTPADSMLINEVYPVLDGVSSVRQAYIDPQSTLDNDAPIKFVVGRCDRELILPCQTELELTLSMMRGAEPIRRTVDHDLVVPCNNIAKSIFKHVEVKINGQQVTTSTSSMYGYRCEIEDRLFTDRLEKTDSLISSGYYLQPGMMSFEKVTNDDAKTMFKAAVAEQKCPQHFMHEHKKWEEGAKRTFMTRIHDDIFNLTKVLPPGTSLEISFDRAEPKFYLISNGTADPETKGYRVQIHRARLYVTYITPTDEKMNQMLATRSFHYQMDCVKPTYFSSSNAISEIVQNCVITGQIPKICILALLDTAAFTGRLKRDPYLFAHANVGAVNVIVNGNKDGTTTTIECKIKDRETNADVTRAVTQLAKVTGVASGITPENFTEGNALFAFNLSPSAHLPSCAGTYSDVPLAGTVDVKIQLDDVPGNNLILLVYTVTSNELVISRDPNVGNSVHICVPEITKRVSLSHNHENLPPGPQKQIFPVTST